MAVTLRYFTEFGKPALQKTICGEFMQESIVFLVRVQCRRKESSRSLSHLLMSFLFKLVRDLSSVFGFAIMKVENVPCSSVVKVGETKGVKRPLSSSLLSSHSTDSAGELWSLPAMFSSEVLGRSCKRFCCILCA